MNKSSKNAQTQNFACTNKFPKVIQEKWRLFYPAAKKPRQNKNNKVRLVQDRLFLNDQEVIVEPEESDDPVSPQTNPGKQYQEKYIHTREKLGGKKKKEKKKKKKKKKQHRWSPWGSYVVVNESLNKGPSQWKM